MNEIIVSSELGDTGMANGQYIITDTDDSRIVGTYPNRSEPDLYSDKAKPHVLYLYADRGTGPEDDLKWYQENEGKLHEARTNVVVLFSGYSTSGHIPVVVDNLGRKFYEYKNWAIAPLIEAIHEAGMKVVGYIYEPSTWGQDYRTTLNLMDEFAKKYNLDGWYIDGGKFGTQVQTLEAFKHMAVMYSTIVLHDSQSVVDGRWIGGPAEEHYPHGIIPAVHIREYVTHTLCGEWQEKDQPKNADDPVWENHVKDNTSNTIRSIKWDDDSPMSETDRNVTAAQKGITIQFKRSNMFKPPWQAYMVEYEKMREEAGGE